MAKELSLEEIKSPEIQDLIETMKATMRAAPGFGLAAPQIGKSLQLAVIEDMDHSHLNGILYIDKAQLATLMTSENYTRLYKDKSVEEIQADLLLK